MDARDSMRRYVADHCINSASVARKAGLTPMQFSNVLHKRRKLDVNELISICKALNTTPDELLATTEEVS